MSKEAISPQPTLIGKLLNEFNTDVKVGITQGKKESDIIEDYLDKFDRMEKENPDLITKLSPLRIHFDIKKNPDLPDNIVTDTAYSNEITRLSNKKEELKKDTKNKEKWMQTTTISNTVTKITGLIDFLNSQKETSQAQTSQKPQPANTSDIHIITGLKKLSPPLTKIKKA